MEQMIKANSIDICYETFGESSNPAVLFVSGLGGQLLGWPDRYMQGVSEAGYHVIRYDNRDVGLSKKFDEAGTPDFHTVVKDKAAGKTPNVPYILADMATDGIGLLDALGIARAHLIGVSMGGMIVQQMAIGHESRLLSMTSIMSNTGDPSLPGPTPEALAVLTTPPPASDDIDSLISRLIINRKAIGGDGFVDDDAARKLATDTIARQFYPVGTARQRAGIMASPSRTEILKNISVPTLVIHGDKDPLVPLEGGILTAETIPGARMEILPGMGHAQYPLYQERVLALMLKHFDDNG
jgi:pimeloyl-ACP methyl ester carboxylesterase